MKPRKVALSGPTRENSQAGRTGYISLHAQSVVRTAFGFIPLLFILDFRHKRDVVGGYFADNFFHFHPGQAAASLNVSPQMRAGFAITRYKRAGSDFSVTRLQMSARVGDGERTLADVQLDLGPAHQAQHRGLDS